MSSSPTLLSNLEVSEDRTDAVGRYENARRVADVTSLAVPPGPPEQAVIDFGPSDESLMQGVAARDSRALDQLHARYRTLLSKIVSPILPNQADAEETLQDVFTEIWTRADRFDGRKGKPLGWIICMTRRRAIIICVKSAPAPKPGRSSAPSMNNTLERSLMANAWRRSARTRWKQVI